MGLGDEIIAAGQARVLHEQTGGPVQIQDTRGRSRWVDVWRGIPYISRTDGEVIVNGIGCRPYIAQIKHRRYEFKRDFWPPRGVIKPDRSSLPELPERFIILEPSIKGTVSSDNKAWIKARWQDVADMVQELGYQPYQFKHQYTRKVLRGAMTDRGSASDLRKAAAIIERAACVVTTDGAYHHCAAALGVPCVVIWGGFTTPDVVGYRDQFNLCPEDERSPCGNLNPCEHCKDCMDRITVTQVMSAIEEALCKKQSS